MDASRKQQLIGLGSEALAEALIQLATQDAFADDMVKRMIAAPKENIRRFKAKLAGIKRMRRFISWRESASFARELECLLDDLQAGVKDPDTGAELVAAFYTSDMGALGNCDDSSGIVGDVYRYRAKALFVDYARQCSDKDRLATMVLKLNQDDAYGVRDSLIDCATQFLSETNIRIMIRNLQQSADQEPDTYRKRHFLYAIESLARQIKDAPLFEKTRIAAWGKVSTAACIDIAQVYLESGDAPTALAWLARIAPDEHFKKDDRDRLLLDVFGELGDAERQVEVAWRIFRRHRSERSLQDLLAVIGEERRATVVADETAMILEQKPLSLADAGFLVALGLMEDAETYLLDRADQLNGDLYHMLLPLAEIMEANDRPLAASAVYRALLDSILRRGRTTTYPHGVRYLKKLDKLAKSVTDWQGFEDHSHYFHELRQDHGRKSSFWSRYEG